jgi:catechol 2,3-dioxygenase-like lactoylglutathione lyase family enzyme
MEEDLMLSDRKVTPMVPTKDLAKARKWYEDKLGLVSTEEMGDGVAYRLGSGTGFFLYQTQFAGTAQHTLLSLDSTDLVSDMKALRARGVVFEDYDFPGLKTVNGMAEFGPVKNAWFKDADGNILAIVEGM